MCKLLASVKKMDFVTDDNHHFIQDKYIFDRYQAFLQTHKKCVTESIFIQSSFYDANINQMIYQDLCLCGLSIWKFTHDKSLCIKAHHISSSK